MSRFDAEPHPLLRPYVHGYWGFARDLTGAPRFTVTPDCYVEVLFFVEPPVVEDGTTVQRLPPCVVIPLLGEPLQLVSSGTVRCAAMRFHAWAAGIVLGQADRPAGGWYDGSAIFAGIVPAVIEHVRASEWPHVAALFDAALLQRFAGVDLPAAAVDAVRTFVVPPDRAQAAGTATVAARHGFSRRQIERSVRLLTDRSPKQLACLTRFQFVRDTLWARPGTELTALALEAGYADQAHLAREFRRYSGQRPSDFKRECARLKTLAAAPDVAIVQDAQTPGRLR